MSTRDLDAAGLRDPRLRRAYAYCHRLALRHGKRHGLARYWFPPAKRPYFDAIVALTHLDDIIDDRTITLQQRTARLDAWERRFVMMLEGGTEPATTEQERGDDDACLAFLHTLRTWHIPLESALEFVVALRADLRTTYYATFRDLEAYMRGQEGRAMLWLNEILEPQGADAAERALMIGLAAQLTDIVRDVGDDLRLGRVYLPQEDLRAFGLTREDLEIAAANGRTTLEIRHLLRFQADRARAWFARGEGYWDIVHPTCREAVHLAASLHRGMLAELERTRYDVLGWQSPLPKARRLASFVPSYFRAVRDRHAYSRTTGPVPGVIRRAG